MITSRYYYSQLSEKNKKIYKAIYDGIKNYQQYVEVPDVTLSDANVGFVYHCVLWDNPYFFAIGEYAMQQAVSSDGKKIKITSLCDAKTEKLYRDKVQTVINEILQTPGIKDLSDFQKEVFVHDFIINNVKYDHTLGNNGTRLEPYTVYGVFVEKKAVCEGIAKAVKLLLNLLDVKCIIVDGKVNGIAHSWNIVKIKDFEYNLDVTFDMGRVIHKGIMRYDYFNFRTVDDAERVVNNRHMMPRCTAIEYNYVIKAGGFVSSYDRLLIYMKKCLTQKKKCMYIKVNTNVTGEFSGLTHFQFREVIKKAYSEATISTRINNKAYLDDTGKMGIYNLEISYLEG